MTFPRLSEDNMLNTDICCYTKEENKRCLYRKWSKYVYVFACLYINIFDPFSI